MPTVQIVIASTRPHRVGAAGTRWIETEAFGHGGFTRVEAARPSPFPWCSNSWTGRASSSRTSHWTAHGRPGHGAPVLMLHGGVGPHSLSGSPPGCRSTPTWLSRPTPASTAHRAPSGPTPSPIWPPYTSACSTNSPCAA